MDVKKYQHILSPINIGSLTLQNRIALAPMGNHLQGEGGSVTEELIAYLRRRAHGGTALIITPFCSTTNDNLTLSAYTDDSIPGFSALADAIHEEGALLFVQLGHLGAMNPNDPVGPSAIASPFYGEIPRALSLEEIHQIVGSFGDAARRVVEAGVDGIELHAAYAYLIASFCSRHLNKRTDEYGGDLTRQMRLLLEIVSVVRDCAPGLPIGCKFNAHEHIEEGSGVEEAKAIGATLGRTGICYLHVVSSHPFLRASECAYNLLPPIYAGKANMVKLAAQIRSAVNVPVIAAGGLDDPLEAERIIAEGQADIIAIGRGLIADPDWVEVLTKNRRRCPCIRCNVCHSREAFESTPVRCSVNPHAGRERWQAGEGQSLRRQRIIIVGGGPAGMQAALSAIEYEHTVTLFEQEDELGGNLRYASVPPFKKPLREFLSYIVERIYGEDIEVHLNTCATAELVLRERPDLVVVATGARPIWPQIPGLDHEFTREAYQVLINRGWVSEARRVVVLGGGKVGCETAWYLRLLGKEVVVVDQLEFDGLLSEEHPLNRSALRKGLREQGIAIKCLRKCIRVDQERTLVLENEAGSYDSLQFDKLILAVGYEPCRTVLSELTNTARHVRVVPVGDCVRPRDIYSAVQEGFLAVQDTMGNGRGLEGIRSLEAGRVL